MYASHTNSGVRRWSKTLERYAMCIKGGLFNLILRPDMHVSRRHRQSKSGQEPIHEMRSESNAEISH